VKSAHDQDKPLFILVQFAQHIGGSNEISVVVSQALDAADLPDRTDCCSTDLANSFRYVVGHGKHQICVIIQEEMVIAKVRARHMPVEVLRLQIKHKYIGKESVESSCNIHVRFMADVGVGC
jgi:hypothetical protein